MQASRLVRIANQPTGTDQPARGTLDVPAMVLNLEAAVGAGYTNECAVVDGPTLRLRHTLGVR